jgi:hypothetical protein
MPDQALQVSYVLTRVSERSGVIVQHFTNHCQGAFLTRQVKLVSSIDRRAIQSMQKREIITFVHPPDQDLPIFPPCIVSRSGAQLARRLLTEIISGKAMGNPISSVWAFAESEFAAFSLRYGM